MAEDCPNPTKSLASLTVAPSSWAAAVVPLAALATPALIVLDDLPVYWSNSSSIRTSPTKVMVAPLEELAAVVPSSALVRSPKTFPALVP